MHTGSSGSVGLSKRKRATGSGNKTQHDSRWELPVFTALPTFLPLSPWLFGGCPALPGRALSEPRSSSRELSPRSLAGRSLLSSWRLRGGNLAGAPSQQSPICSKRTLGGSLSRREGCVTFAVKLHGWPQRHWLRISKVILIFEKPSQEENTRKASDAGDLGVRGLLTAELSRLRGGGEGSFSPHVTFGSRLRPAVSTPSCPGDLYPQREGEVVLEGGCGSWRSV